MTFWHIPWPAWDVFRICPQRAELLDGLLGSDLVGLQHPRHVAHFLECAEQEPGAQVDRDASTVEYDGRLVHVQAFPISVDAAGLEQLARSDGCERWMSRVRARLGLAGRLLVLGVDRLDYTKGIPERFRALEVLLQRGPVYRERLVFIQKSAPSRTQIKSYRDLQQRVEDAVDRINAAYGTEEWRPITYMPEALPLDAIAALYRMADVCVVSSLADGMNLVAKEFIACQVDHRGVLVLSELAGARDELPWAVSINPYDAEGFAGALRQALEMEPEERRARMEHLRAYVADHDIYGWMTQHLQSAGRLLATRAASHWLLDHADQIRDRVTGRPLALLLDFDGTLAPIAPSPELAVLPDPVRETLRRLAGRRDVLVAVISGRSLDDIRRRVAVDGFVYAGNHGLEMATHGLVWTLPEAESTREAIAQICRRLRERLERVTGVLVEDKGLTASVHYRQTPLPQVEEVRMAVLEEAARIPQQRYHQRQVLGQVAGDQELLPHRFTRVASHLRGHVGVVEQIADAERAALHRVDRVAGDSPNDLHRDPAGEAADDGLALPHPLRHGEAEALAGGLLDDDRGGPLQRVDLMVCGRREHQDVDVRIMAAGVHHLSQDLRALRVVIGRSAGQDQPAVVVFLHQPVRVDDTQRVLEPVEAGDLQQDRLVLRDAEPLQHGGNLVGC